MTKVRQDFTIYSGDNSNLTYTITDSNGASVDNTGASISWLVYDLDTSASILLISTAGSEVTIAGCTFTIAVEPTHTASMQGFYGSEVEMTDTAGNVSTIAVGIATIRKDRKT